METRVAAPGSLPARLVQRASRIFDAQYGQLLPSAPVCFGAGAGVYFCLRWEPAPLDYAAVALVGLLAALHWWRDKITGSPPACALMLLCLGLLWAGGHAHLSAAPVLEYRYYGPIEGRIVAIDRSMSGKLRLTLDQVVLDRFAPLETPRRVRVSLHGEQSYLDPKPGLTVMMTGHLAPPSGPVEPGGFDFQRKAWFDRLGGVGYTRTPALALAPAQDLGLALTLFRLRKEIAEGLKARIDGRAGPFAAAILTGDRSDLDADAVEDLRASNLAHLLAISGLHMGLLTGVIFAAVRFGCALLPALALRLDTKKGAAAVALLGALAYLGLSGANVATQRAFVMVAVMLLAIWLERRAITLRAVAVAGLIVLILAPESLLGPGFQMSFAATTALVAVFAALRDSGWLTGQGGSSDLRRWLRPVLTLVLSSAVAGAATAPFGAAHFNQIAQYGLPANLLSVPVMGLVVMPGAVLAACLVPLGLEGIGLAFVAAGLNWILLVAETVAGYDGALRHIPAPGPAVLPLVALGGLVLCLWQGRGRIAGVAVLAGAAGLWALTDRPEVLISENGRLVGIATPQGRVLNKPKGQGFAARAWLENDGDPIDQPGAFKRGALEANAFEFSIENRSLRFDAAKDLTPATVGALCADADLVILPRYDGVLPCRGLTRRDFAENGAHAIRLSAGDIHMDSSRARRGTRLWVREAPE
ncbi:MAG: ComEC/Rec2 family competence protein [Paracoccaceae bacterium]